MLFLIILTLFILLILFKLFMLFKLFILLFMLFIFLLPLLLLLLLKLLILLFILFIFLLISLLIRLSLDSFIYILYNPFSFIKMSSKEKSSSISLSKISKSLPFKGFTNSSFLFIFFIRGLIFLSFSFFEIFSSFPITLFLLFI